MIDPRLLRQDAAEVSRMLSGRGFVLDVERYQRLEADRKELQIQTEKLQAERNTKSKAIGRAKANGEVITPLLQEVGALGQSLNEAKARFNEAQRELSRFLEEIPNLPDSSVPKGDSEADNAQIGAWGEPPKFEFDPLDHVDLVGSAMDFENAAKITGSRFVVMSGPLPRLHRALTQFMLDVHTEEHGYEEIYVPYIVNRNSLEGTGQLPKFKEDQFELVGDENFYLVPTAEVPVTNLIRDEIIEEGRLPLRYVAHTPCFRKEAGSYGKDTRGIIRQHQFEKVELVQIVEPDNSWEALESLKGHAEEILKRLELPYRSMALCGGDLGFSAAKTIDLEVWLPGQNRFREISSCSNYLDFQARRMLSRYRKPETGKPEFVHTLNGSGLAVGRTLVAVLENFQTSNRSVQVPDALRPYLRGLTKLEFEEE